MAEGTTAAIDRLGKTIKEGRAILSQKDTRFGSDARLTLVPVEAKRMCINGITLTDAQDREGLRQIKYMGELGTPNPHSIFVDQFLREHDVRNGAYVSK